MLVYGLILVLSLMFMPEGIAGLVGSIVRRVRGKSNEESAGGGD
jgi:hypothetical protein